jgi:hypothetical protein
MGKHNDLVVRTHDLVSFIPGGRWGERVSTGKTAWFGLGSDALFKVQV